MGKFSARTSVCFIVLFLLAGLGFFRSNFGESQAVSRVVEEALGAKSAPAALDLLRADFPEPFISTVKGADKEPLASVLERYASDPRPKSKKVDLLEGFLEEHPDNPWAPSVRVNLGLTYQKTGRFSKTLKHLEQAWDDLKDAEDIRLKALADHALGAYSQTLAHLGRLEELKPLLKSVENRSLSGSATELLAASREGLLQMEESPDYSFWCGPAALRRIGEQSPSWTQADYETLRACTSTIQGTTLLRNRDLSREIGLNYQMAYREPGSQLITPAVVHWKVGHFAALFPSEADGTFSVEDNTAGFGHEVTLMGLPALEEESSGYFLVPAGPLPSGWRSVTDEEGSLVWGRGYTGFKKDFNATRPADHKCPTGCDQQSKGMTTWSAHTMLVSLSLTDTPVGLSPAAFSVPFTVTYAQREINQPSIFDYANLGPKWTNNWTSFLTDDRTRTRKVVLYEPGGGAEDFLFASGTATISHPGEFSQNTLEEVAEGFRLTMPSGAYREYHIQIGDRYHLTRLVDPQGNEVALEYDSSNRLSSIRDTVGREMTLSYDLPEDPLKITRVTDPFGRFATFSYTADGHLESITDTIGLVSSYTYGENDFITSLSTPYGTTSFSYGDVSTNSSLRYKRYLEIVDPEGRKYRLESDESVPQPILPAPQGMPLQNAYLQYRNSFFWEPHQLDETPVYAKATLYHFMHGIDSGYNLSRVLESVKKPLENRVWFAYDRNTHPRIFTTPGRELRTHIGRVLGDGSTQLTKYQYNDAGFVTQTTDPAGRVFNYTYAPNEIDLTSVSTGGQSLFSATYDDSHNITSLIDASGGTSTFTYNSRGQVTSTTNPLGETTSYTYTLTGNLYTIEAPMQKVTTFLYDDAERVSTVVDSEGYSAQVTYDALDRPLSVTYPDGTTDTLTYDRLEVVASKDRLGRQTQMTYDNLGRVKSILDANGGTTSLGYGLVDSPTSLTDPNGNTTTFQFDLQARLQAKKYADGAQQTISYQACCGRLKSVTDAAGNTKTYSYYLDNQLKGIDYSGQTPDVSFTNDPFLPRPLSMTDGQGTTSITYGPVGAPGANQVSSISGPFGDTASFSYDIAGRPVSSVVNGSPSFVTYDALWRPTSITNELDTFQMDYLGKTGQVTSVSSAFGPASQYTYAANIGDRRLLQIKNLRNNGTPLSQFDYTYDAVGQITRLSAVYGDGSGSDDGDDDDNDDNDDGHCTCKKKKDHHKNGKGKGKGKAHDKHKHHDKHGKHKGHDKYDNHGHGDHDRDCEITKKKERKNKHSAHKNKNKGKDKNNGKHKAKAKSKGHHEHHANYQENSLIEWLIRLVFEEIWGWDVSDWQIDCDDEESETGASTGSETWDFRYDNLSQLVGVDLNQTPYASYEIDAAGNLTSVTIDGITTSLTHNSLNQTTSPGTPGYDPKGQTTTDAEGRTFEWDEQGRVTAIVTGNKRSEFGYDGLSRRTVITEYEDDTMVSKKLYWWLGGSIVTERDALQTDYPITKRYFGQGVLRTASLGGGAATKLYYTTDHLGSVRELLDQDGNVVAEYRYSIYGERTKISGNLDSDWGFAGLFHHEPSGLDLATYRLYDAKQGRFISRDPLGEAVDYNLYRYGGNNPVNFVDPEGLEEGFMGVGGFEVWQAQVQHEASLETQRREYELFISGHAGDAVGLITDTVVFNFFGKFVGALRGSRPFAASTINNAGRNFSSIELSIVNEAGSILNSSSFSTLRKAHKARKSATVKIGCRTIQYEPSLGGASGMTLFGENGFLISSAAFVSEAELSKTILHELFRLSTSRSASGISGALSASETSAAFSFAERAYGAFFR